MSGSYAVISNNNILNYRLSLCSVSDFRFNTRTKTRVPLPDCRVNNALIQFVLSCQSGYANTSSTSLIRPLRIGGPVIMPHRVH